MFRTSSRPTRSCAVPGGEPVYRWRIARALPVKLLAPSFVADSNEVAIETLEVMASGITVLGK